MTKLVETLNSVYELDEDNARFRRVRGPEQTCSRNKPDGEWQPYCVALGPCVGQSLIVILRYNPETNIHESISTSRVVAIRNSDELN